MLRNIQRVTSFGFYQHYPDQTESILYKPFDEKSLTILVHFMAEVVNIYLVNIKQTIMHRFVVRIISSDMTPWLSYIYPHTTTTDSLPQTQ